MTLCDLCASIPFDGLPPYPSWRYTRTYLSGCPHFQHGGIEFGQGPAGDVPPERFAHQPDLASLRRAAAAGCGLCGLLEGQVTAVLADLAGLDQHMRASCGNPPQDYKLWLTEKPKGRGRGFWATAEMPAMGDVYLLGAIAFCAEEDDPLASVLRGRPVRDTPSTATFNQILGWLKACDDNHHCRSGPSLLPVRLIDVNGSSESRHCAPQVVDLAKHVPKGHYAALTYGSDLDSFGPPPSLDEAVRDGQLDISRLPKLFQDAIEVTRRLGVKYLWIDRLCTPNDQLDDWARDSANWAAVFENAYITLSATGCKDWKDGLLFNRNTSPQVRLEHRRLGDKQGTLLLCTVPLNKNFVTHYYVEMKGEPLSDSAWAFQERTLSRRIVHFASDQVYFECMAGLSSEDGLMLKERSATVEPPLYDPADDHDNTPWKGKDGPARDKIWLSHRWGAVVAAYSRRSPSDPADKLLAISNIARKFAPLLLEGEDGGGVGGSGSGSGGGGGGNYLAGLWRSSGLLKQLMWQALRCRPPPAGAPYRAPSWSWAAIDGFTPLARVSDAPWDPIAKILDVDVRLADDACPFGAVREGTCLKMEAPLVPLRLVETDAEGGPMSYVHLMAAAAAAAVAKGEGGGNGGVGGGFAGLDTIDRRLEVSADLLRTMELYALVVLVVHRGECRDGSCGFGDMYKCLIVTPVDGNADVMRRIGFYHIGPDDLAADEISSSRKVFTFV